MENTECIEIAIRGAQIARSALELLEVTNIASARLRLEFIDGQIKDMKERLNEMDDAVRSNDGAVGCGVFVTEKELAELKSLASRAMRGQMVSARMGPGPTDQAIKALQVRVHELALSHGLPEYGGYYGLRATGEFIRPGAAG